MISVIGYGNSIFGYSCIDPVIPFRLQLAFLGHSNMRLVVTRYARHKDMPRYAVFAHIALLIVHFIRCVRAGSLCPVICNALEGRIRLHLIQTEGNRVFLHVIQR